MTENFQTLFEQGSKLLIENNYSEALNVFLKIENEIKETEKHKKLLQACKENLYKIYKHEGKLKEAVDYLGQSMDLKAKIYNEISQKRDEALAQTHKIEIEKAESQILKEKNNELNRLNIELNKLNEEKNVFLNIAAKDLSAPLNSISLIASTLNTFYDKYSQEDFLDRIKKIETASSKMQETVNTLLQNVRHNTKE